MTTKAVPPDDSFAELVQQATAFPLGELPRACGGPAGRGVLKAGAEDFFVEEILGFELEGEGEHLLVQVEKRGLNTVDVANALRKASGVKQVDVSYAGLKDRHAVARQWFSIYLPGKTDPDLSDVEGDGLRLLRQERHSRKLRRGALRGNRFRLVVRDFDGDQQQADTILCRILERGFPNYFGEQRFGRNNSNLVRAAELFSGRRRMRRGQKGFPLSAARSLLFNRVLAARVTDGNWDKPLEGEVFLINGAKGLFRENSLDEEIRRRCAGGEIHPTGPLWGRDDRVQPLGEARDAELQALSMLHLWREGLEKEGVAGDRRALRAWATDLQWVFEAGRVELEFVLGRGSFATSLVREWLSDEMSSDGVGQRD